MEPNSNNDMIILRRAKLTTSMFIEEFALLDYGASLTAEGKLPEDKYGIYYRVGIQPHREVPAQYLNDHITSELTKMASKLDWTVFIVR